MDLIEIKNGDRNSHIKFDENYRFELTDDCSILASSGFTIMKPYEKASVIYLIQYWSDWFQGCHPANRIIEIFSILDIDQS